MAALIAAGFGFAMAGMLGVLTGIVAAVGTGSGLAIAVGGAGSSVASQGLRRTAQRLGGAVGAMGCLAGALYGGWRVGSLWAALGYALGPLAVGIIGAWWVRGGERDEVGDMAAPLTTNSGEAAALPSTFNLNDREHVALADDIRKRFGELLANESHEYAGCMYRPASLLPYPKSTIREALTALLRLAEGSQTSTILSRQAATPEFAELLRANIEQLDDFLEVPAKALPTDPIQNVRVGLDLQGAR